MLSADTFNLWFAPLRATGFEGDCVVLEVANDFCEVWLKDNYQGLLQDVLSIAAARQLRAKFVVANGQPTVVAPARPRKLSPCPSPKPVAAAHQDRAAANGEWSFNSRTRSRPLSSAITTTLPVPLPGAVAERWASPPQPPVFYGRGRARQPNPFAPRHRPAVATNKKGARVGYVSSEKFTNEYIDAIQNNSLVKFRKKYRQTDVLLIDDIQFLPARNGFREEFFTRSMRCTKRTKQIVLTVTVQPAKSGPRTPPRLAL